MFYKTLCRERIFTSSQDRITLTKSPGIKTRKHQTSTLATDTLLCR